MVVNFQNTALRTRYARVPVVAAPFGLALGGGAEVILGCQTVRASSELYMGLVEVGVGLLPGAADKQDLVTWCVAATVVLFLLGWMLGLATAYANISFGQQMIYDLAANLFDHLQRLSFRFYDQAQTGQLMSRATSDVDALRRFLGFARESGIEAVKLRDAIDR